MSGRKPEKVTIPPCFVMYSCHKSTADPGLLALAGNELGKDERGLEPVLKLACPKFGVQRFRLVLRRALGCKQPPSFSLRLSGTV